MELGGKSGGHVIDDSARRFHGDAPIIQSLGDGVQTSVGLVAAVLGLPDKIILIDEPEAFLHPTLARRVGKVLAKAARDREASLIMASHSSELLLGCMQSEPNLRIVRLTYTGGLASARSLDPTEIRQLMNDPLLRSAHSLRALFHRGAIICEADADRAFYEEVNARMSADDRGIEDCIFMNAQNWQTIPRLVEPLRRLGVPALAVFDFDVLMSKDFASIWQLVNLDAASLHGLQEERASIKLAMEKAGRANCKKLGLDALGSDKSAAEDLLSRFASFGVMFVPVGELECWLKTKIPEQVSKQNWLMAMFEAMGADPEDALYLKAGVDDVWAFIETARLWVDNPERQGMPN
ncbi:ATP-dependent nuclease [Sphingobium fuliginis]|uniref:ATP-dependent nuclease n=1 Tax=Sphingobium fuliginis (strain ATCC 27551) TaxID=336203 RepID=UPI000C07ED1B